MDYNKEEDKLFCQWARNLNVSMDEFVSDGLLFQGEIEFDGINFVRKTSGPNSFNWDNAKRRLLIITRDQPCDDGNIWDVRGDVPLKKDHVSFKPEQIFKCLIPWVQATLEYDKKGLSLSLDDKDELIDFWIKTPMVRINCSKLAGKRVKDGGCSRNKVIGYLEDNKDFFLKQIKLYDANIIMCCSGYDVQSNPIIDFLQKYLLQDLLKINNYVWFSNKEKVMVLDTYHFSNWKFHNLKNIIGEANNIKEKILDAKLKGYLLP